MTHIIRVTEEECRAELEGIYAAFPFLREHHEDCCAGCAESDIGYEYGWGAEVTAWRRISDLRFLLGDER